MAGRVIYLDSDDEITSAAARIRDVDAARVAVVLPYGSRVATSRINFRLLARDALSHEKRLVIVSGDAATRALAASAGLPVFASVAEYEASVQREEGPAAAGSGAMGGAAAGMAGAGAATGAGVPAATGTAARPGTPGDTSGGGSAAWNGSGGGGGPVPATPLGTGAGETVRADIPRDQYVPEGAGAAAGVPVGSTGRSRTAAGGQRSRGGASRATLAAGIAILALAGVVAAVGAYLLVPSATIAVTPQPEAMTPLDLTVVADPAATVVDPTGLVVPATTVRTDVSVNGTFQATGMRVEETNATGIVRFENLDFLNSNTVPGGSIVGTNSGVRFRTNATVTVPKAGITGLSLFPGKISVKVTAVKPGEDGNVDPNTIVVVPAGEDPIALKVTNPTATTGGTHQEFPRVTQQDVDAAMASLGTQLAAAFQTKLTDPSLTPVGSTLFLETSVLGQATPTVDPATLVGQEVQSFDLGLTANGSALAVDTGVVGKVAEAQMTSRLEADHRLVSGSMDVNVGDGSVVGQTVRFPVTVSAEQIRVLDPEKLKTLILGKSVAEAQAILAPYGKVDVSIWPDWLGRIPSFESRVTLTVERPPTGGGASPSPAPSLVPSPSPTSGP